MDFSQLTEFSDSAKTIMLLQTRMKHRNSSGSVTNFEYLMIQLDFENNSDKKKPYFAHNMKMSKLQLETLYFN